VKSSESTVAKSLEGDYRPEHIFALRQSLAAYRYYQQLVLETDQEIQRQMVELEAAGNALARCRSEPSACHTNDRGTNRVSSIFAANSIGFSELT
jgi:transposase